MSETFESSQTSQSRREGVRESWLGVFVGVVAKLPKNTDRRKFIEAARHVFLSPGYEDFLDDLIREMLSLKFSEAYGAAFPPTEDELVARAKERTEKSERAATERRQRADDLKKRWGSHIHSKLFDQLMPNGKRLADCRGAECVEFGGWYVKIGVAAGDRLVKDALTPEAVVELLSA